MYAARSLRSWSVNAPKTGIGPGPTRVASTISVGVDSISVGAAAPPPIAAPERDAT